jgi:predicted choloylglycine hydrolase
MMRYPLYPVLLAVVVIAVSCGTAEKLPRTAPAGKPLTPEARLVGSPVQIGAKHGHDLGPAIKSLHDQFLQQWMRTDVQRAIAFGVAQRFEQQVLPEHKAELAAVADAAGIERQQLMLSNCFLDVSSMVTCSTMTLPGAMASDGVPRFARNLDFPSFNIADKHSVVFAIKPDDGRYGFVHVGWPGLIGVLSGMNEHGLTIANMEVNRDTRPPSAMPYTLLYRTLLERCRTVDEALALLEKTPRQTANNLMIMDATGDRAVAEIYPDQVLVRRGEAGSLISTNHRREGADYAKGPEQFCHRYARMEAVTRDPDRKFGVVDLQKLLAQVAQGDMTLQSMVFEPSNRAMYLATGKNAPTRQWERVDIKSLLE